MAIPTAAAPTRPALSFALTDAQGRLLAAERPERPFYAASTIKLHVLLAALRAAAAGRLDLAASAPVTRTFTGVDGAPFTLGGDHLDPTHPADGTGMQVREMLVRMIDRSSNEATNQVTEMIGLEAVQAAIGALGLSSTRMERLIGDAAALERGRTNETSAADLVRTTRVLVTDPTLTGAGHGARPDPTAAARDLARAALGAQRIRLIAPALRPGVPVGSKSGWVEGYRHDAAVIGAGEDTHHLAVMTAGMPEDEADRAIGEVVRTQLPHLAR